MKHWNKLALMICLVFLINSNSLAYDEKIAHPKITETAIGRSNLNDYLKSYLSIQDGTDHYYGNKTIVQLIQAGSTNEDATLLSRRAQNHFWNPIALFLSPPKSEGLNDILTGNPNKGWALGDFDCLMEGVSGDHTIDKNCNDYSWRKARYEFYQGVTCSDQVNKNKHYKNMYESLGRILHLMEDMGVPAHTRNDFTGHLDYTGFNIKDMEIPLGNLYEAYVAEKAKDSTFISAMAPLTIPKFNTQQEYWGNGNYIGTNPDITITNSAGLAEYTNANFLSRYTIFTDTLSPEDKHYFPYPKESSISNPYPHVITAEDGKQDTVVHLNKDKDGELINEFVGVKYVWDKLSEKGTVEDWRLSFFLDDTVHDAYAEKIIPKTIGYAAGLIDYFFRGTMEISLPEDGVYAFRDTEPTDPKTQGFNKVRLLVKNTTSTDDQMLGGEVDLIVQYRYLMNRECYGDPLPCAKDPLTNETYKGLPMDLSNFHISDPQYIVKPYTGDKTINSVTPTLLEFELSDKEIPLWAVDVSFSVVYKGKLGKDEGHVENSAVCIGYKDVSEPSPVIFANSEDIFCYDGVWWYDLNNSDNLKTLKDTYLNNSCIRSMTVPDLLNLVLKFSPKDVTPAVTQYTIDKIEPGQYKRMYLITDYDAVLNYSSPSYALNDNTLADIGLRNGFVNENDIIIWRYPTFTKFRGIEMWDWSNFVQACASCLNGDNCSVCDKNTIDENKNLVPVGTTQTP